MLFLEVESILTEEIEKLKNSKQWWEKISPQILNFFIKFILVIILFCITRRMISLLVKCLEKIFQKANIEPTLRKFLIPAIRGILNVLIFFFFIDFLGVPSSSIVAILGSTGLAVGLALQGSLSNVAGGVLILLLKPFRVNDYIYEHKENLEGKVKAIGVFYTTLITGDNRVIVLPNGNLANSSISNFTATPTRRVDLQVGISYESNLSKAKKILEEVLQNQENRCLNTEVSVYVAELKEHAVILGFRAWFPSELYWETSVALLEKVKLALEEGNISNPYQVFTRLNH
ncbi:mechanosensitive ion channel protein MscS [Clostridia bacterium]|nr:mechanosensitive ion channel protein MscS [Clostridia bacterium]